MAQEQVGFKLTLDANDGLKSLKDLKNSIKEAKGDLIAMAEKFGETSNEARAAAKRVAELEDAIGDSKTLIDQFNPDKKFNAFAQSLNGVLGGFSALQGAMGLLGVESEDLQKQLLKVQSAMALSQGLNQVMESGNALRNFGKTIINTFGKGGAIGIAIAGVAALGYALYEAFSQGEKLTDQQKALNEVNAEAVKIYASEKQKLDQLVRPLQNENTTKQEKLAAIKKLQETYPNYFKNLDLENGKVVGLAEGYAKVIKAIELKARATAAANMLAKQEEQLLELGFKYGITTEEDANKFLANLEKTGNTFLLSIANGVKAKREFLQNIQAEAEKGLSAAGGDPTGGTKAPVKDKASEKELKKEYDFGVTKSEIRQNAQLTLMKNDDLFRQMLSDQQMKWDEEDLAQEQEMYYAQRQANEEYQNAIIANEEMAAQTRIQTATSVANAFGALSEVFGKQTAAGKALAIAQATINTWVGVTEVLRAKSVLPEPFGTISKIANVAAIVASGINAIKNISKTQVPGAAGGGSGSMSAPTLNSPLTPQIGVTNTQLNQQQLNQLGNATTRAYVVESDVSGNQERIRRLNRAARLG